MIIQIDHVTLNVESAEVCVEFYTKIIGLAPENYEEWKNGEARFPSVRINADNMIHFFPPEMWEELGDFIRAPGKVNHVCLAFEKNEWNALLDRLEINQVEVRGPFILMGSHGKGTSIFIDDPEGFKIELKTYD